MEVLEPTKFAQDVTLRIIEQNNKILHQNGEILRELLRPVLSVSPSDLEDIKLDVAAGMTEKSG